MKKIVRGMFLVLLIWTVMACGGSPDTRTVSETVITWDDSLTTGITRITSDGIRKKDLAVSPDGTKILYSEATKQDSNGRPVFNIVYLRDVNNPGKTPLINDSAYAPSWYEDDNQFLYVAFEGGRGKIVRSSASGAGKTYITRTSVDDYDNPSIKDGLILCSSMINNKRQLVTMRENGTEMTILGEGSYPSWHPTENKILFVRSGDICIMDLGQNNQVTQIYTDSQYACDMPSYSPDGKKIIFAKETLTRTDATKEERSTILDKVGNILSSKKTNEEDVVHEISQTHIFVINADGMNPSPLSGGTAKVSAPRLGRNGDIFCLVDNGVSQEIYRLRLRNQ